MLILLIVDRNTWNFISKNVSKVGDRNRGLPEGSLFDSYTPRCRGGCKSFPRIDSLYLWYVPYNAAKQRGIKYHFKVPGQLSCKKIVLDWNTWNHITDKTVCKLFVLKIVTLNITLFTIYYDKLFETGSILEKKKWKKKETPTLTNPERVYMP